MPVQQGNDEAERPLVAPVKAPGLLIRAIAMVSVILVMVAFVLGFRLGGAGAPGTSQVVQATATGLAAPSTTASPTVPFAAVSDALRRAYRAAGAGSAICVVDGAPGCQKMGYNPSDRVYQPFAGDATDLWTSLAQTTVRGVHLVRVAAFPSAYQTAAILMRLDAAGHPVASSNLLPANPDRQGIYYLDLGSLTPGHYLLVLGSFEQLAPPPAGGPVYGWRTYVDGLTVVGPELRVPVASCTAGSWSPTVIPCSAVWALGDQGGATWRAPGSGSRPWGR